MNSSPQNQPDPPLPPPTAPLEARAAKSTSKGTGSAKTAPAPRGRFLSPTPTPPPSTSHLPPHAGASTEPALAKNLNPIQGFVPVPLVSPVLSRPAHATPLIPEPETTRPSVAPEDFWREHLALSAVPVAISAPGQGWLFFNQAFCTLLGYSETEIRNHSWITLTHPDDRAADTAQFNRLLSGETPVLRQTKRLLKRDGQPIRVVTTTTARRRADGIVESLYVTLWEKAEPPSSQPGWRETIQRLADLENQLLHRYPKSESQVQELGLWNEWTPVDPVQLLKGIQDHLQEWSRAHRIQWNIGSRLPLIQGNLCQLRRAIENVFCNAMEALEGRPGGIEVSCASQWVEGDMLDASLMGYQPVPGDYLALEIRDEGPGMDALTQRRLFEPRFTRKNGHLGLGGTIVLEVMRRHAGVIRVSTVPGRGTALRLFLPIHIQAPQEADSVPETTPSPSPSTSTSMAAQRSPLSVLLVDDEEGVRSVLGSMMETMGCRVTGVGDASSALEHFKAQPKRYSAILLDWSLPGVAGSRLLQQFRELSPGIPVILMSGYLEGQCSDEAEEKPSAFLQKPFTRDCLEAALKSVSLPQRNV